MNKGREIILQVSLCIGLLGICLFSYLEKQNQLTELRIYVPKLVKEMRAVKEKNIELNYQIQQFERPDHLMQLASDPKFSHLKYPVQSEVLVLHEPDTKQETQTLALRKSHAKVKHTLAVGAK